MLFSKALNNVVLFKQMKSKAYSNPCINMADKIGHKAVLLKMLEPVLTKTRLHELLVTLATQLRAYVQTERGTRGDLEKRFWELMEEPHGLPWLTGAAEADDDADLDLLLPSGVDEGLASSFLDMMTKTKEALYSAASAFVGECCQYTD